MAAAIARISPVRICCKNIRLMRQKETNNRIVRSIMSNDILTFKAHSNEKEVARVLDELECDISSLFAECKENVRMAKIFAGRVAKKSTRQGSKDEETQLKVCGETSKKLGITITNLSSTAYRPTKSGEIITKEDMKAKRIGKDECLKSFDAKISGRVNGWVFAKVVYGSGGHQDNVFEEADTLCEWVCKYKSDTGELFVVLIDTDLDRKLTVLKEKYSSHENILIADHYNFQEYLIAKYS
jgi:hypothetical protein